MNIKTALFSLLSIIYVISFISCAKVDTAKVEEVLEAVEDAINAGDEAGLLAHLSESAADYDTIGGSGFDLKTLTDAGGNNNVYDFSNYDIPEKGSEITVSADTTITSSLPETSGTSKFDMIDEGDQDWKVLKIYLHPDSSTAVIQMPACIQILDQ